jgi:hypothetical protein
MLEMNASFFNCSKLVSFVKYLPQDISFLKFVGLAMVGKDIVFRFIIEYTSLRDFGPWVIVLFLCMDFFKIIF